MSSFYSTVFALSLLVLEASATAPCCSKLPYAVFTPLSKHSAAQKFCTSKYPIPRPTCLFTTTIPTTTTVLATTSVAPVTATVTVTTGQGSTVIDSQTITPSTVIVTETSSVSTTITSCPQQAPVITPRANPQPRGNADDKLAPIFSSLQKQASSFVKTLCSCIETTPGCSTSTLTTHPTIRTTKTVTLTYAPKVTVSIPNTVVVTKLTTVILPIPTSTTTVTQTATSTYCAPPKATTCVGGVKPLVCDPSFFCTSNESCVCIRSTEDDVACADTSAIVQNCSDVVSCGSSADCGTGQMCVTNLCCSDRQCVDVKTDTCPNGQLVSRLFRAAPVRAGKLGNNFPPGSKR